MILVNLKRIDPIVTGLWIFQISQKKPAIQVSTHEKQKPHYKEKSKQDHKTELMTSSDKSDCYMHVQGDLEGSPTCIGQ
jgi:hypothetical protein